MTNAFTIDRSKPSIAIELDKNNRHRQKMTKWVSEQREKGKEPMRIDLPNTPERKKVR